TVTTLDDVVNATVGVFSLREALTNAHTLGNAPTIVFAESLSGGTITLTSKLGAITTDMTIDGDIDGDGKADITIDGGGKYRFFDLSTADVTLSLNGLILQNGHSELASTGNGGVINLSAAGVTMNLINSTITGSKNKGNGAIFYISAAGVTVNMTDSTFSNNTSYWCGAVLYSDKANTTVTVTRSKILNNSSSDAGTPATDGGAIYLRAGSDNSKITIVDSLFEGNTVPTISGSSIAIVNSKNTQVTISGTTFKDNSAGVYGGAIHFYGSTTSTLNITDSIFTGNSTTKSFSAANTLVGGGAIYVNGGIVNISGSTFTGNHADGKNTASSADRLYGGGSIGVQTGTLNVTGTNSFTGNYSKEGHGGAIHTYAGTINISGTNTFAENKAGVEVSASNGHGGAIYIHNQDTANLTVTGNTLFRGNIANSWGGAISSNDKGEVYVEGATFLNNQVNKNYGSAIYNGGNLTIVNSTFTGNFKPTENTASAVVTNEGKNGKIYVINSTFYNNLHSDSTIASSQTVYDVYAQSGVTNATYVINSIYDVGFDANV
ncbi:MAG: hypothetical protein J6Q65_03725, partial [Lentisphaeria bacterium]|nr:hypothetical protein [Lentisphaeria bacterium]